MTMQFPLEHTLSLHITDAASVKLICTDAAIEALIGGFLFNEGLIADLSHIQQLTISPDHTQANVQLSSSNAIPGSVRGSGFGSPLLDAAPVPLSLPIQNRYCLHHLQQCAKQMEDTALLYQQTGGMHCSALFDQHGLIAQYEDIGRHNTLDKLAGHCLLEQIDASDSLLITTGRISQDMVRKAARIGACIIASYSTPTQQAVDMAQAANMTLVRYLGKSCTLCTVPERIIL